MAIQWWPCTTQRSAHPTMALILLDKVNDCLFFFFFFFFDKRSKREKDGMESETLTVFFFFRHWCGKLRVIVESREGPLYTEDLPVIPRKIRTQIEAALSPNLNCKYPALKQKPRIEHGGPMSFMSGEILLFSHSKMFTFWNNFSTFTMSSCPFTVDLHKRNHFHKFWRLRRSQEPHPKVEKLHTSHGFYSRLYGTVNPEYFVRSKFLFSWGPPTFRKHENFVQPLTAATSLTSTHFIFFSMEATATYERYKNKMDMKYSEFMVNT